MWENVGKKDCMLQNPILVILTWVYFMHVYLAKMQYWKYAHHSRSRVCCRKIDFYRTEFDDLEFFCCPLSMGYLWYLNLFFRGSILPSRFERGWSFPGFAFAASTRFLSVPFGHWWPIHVDQIPTRYISTFHVARKQSEAISNHSTWNGRGR